MSRNVPKQEQLVLDVQGMTCTTCARQVERALQQAPGVKAANVPGWESGKAVVSVEPHASSQRLVEAVNSAGYSATIRRRQTEKRATARNGGKDYDLMVIGAGSAGFAAAIKGAELGYEVAMVESGTIGGTCVNVGCVPSKNLIRALEQVHQAKHPRFPGIHTSAERLDWPTLIAQKDDLVAEMRQSRYVDVLDAYPQVSYLRGRARLSGGNGVEIDGRPYTSGKIIIATGTQPWAPPLPGLAEAGYLTSTTALQLENLPDSMLVLGANAVGLELAQIFARAGTPVTLLELMPRIAPFEDEALSDALHDYLQDEGIRILTAFTTERVQKRDGRYYLTGRQEGPEITLDAAQLLVATGRRPNTVNMGLEDAGVRLGKRGEILVYDTLRTDNPDVYAAGDVIGDDMYVYVAAYGGGLAAENALSGAGRIYDTSAIPRVTFTDPQIASTGLTEAQAREAGYSVQVSTLPMDLVPRALAARDTRGLIKLVIDESTDRLLGVHALTPEAGEIIQTAVLAMRFGITAANLRETMFPYLTNVEGIKLAALGLKMDLARLSCCAG